MSPAVLRAPLDDLQAFLRHRLAGPLPGPDAQRRFASRPPRPEWAPDLTPATARRAAALILLYPGDAGTVLPLTVRHADLAQHPGQVSLPGGAIDPGESAEAAALREADEELGVPRDVVIPLGSLSTLWIPVSNFIVTPVVGIARARPAFRPHPREVAAVVELPLAHLVDGARIGWARRDDARGGPIDYPYFDVEGHAVWGATAMILSELACLFEPDHGPPPR
jgi:8-oxo-dGTP pyrophosphatase MutT (NUDIX family)